jgi:NTP pyrophosphatase (non-canonical NTP hydrolase)
MDEVQYREEVLRTYAGPNDPLFKLSLGAMGLAGETGEVVDLVKKVLFQGHRLDGAMLVQEMGDVLWYLMLLCEVLGCTFADLMAANVNKLHGRYPDGFDVDRSRERGEGAQSDEYCWAHTPGGYGCVQCQEMRALELL